VYAHTLIYTANDHVSCVSCAAPYTGKKLGALRMTARKLQGVYLELSLRQASGWACGGNSAIGGDQQQQQQP
jgi:hypothetical protein